MQILWLWPAIEMEAAFGKCHLDGEFADEFLYGRAEPPGKDAIRRRVIVAYELDYRVSPPQTDALRRKPEAERLRFAAVQTRRDRICCVCHLRHG